MPARKLYVIINHTGSFCKDMDGKFEIYTNKKSAANNCSGALGERVIPIWVSKTEPITYKPLGKIKHAN